MDLPELEIARRWLAENAVGRRVRAVHTPSGMRRPEGLDALCGQTIDAVTREGCTLTLRCGDQALELRVDGEAALYVGSRTRDMPLPWRLALSCDACAIWLVARGNARRARVRRTDACMADGARTGVDPLSAAFTLAALKKGMAHKRRSIRRLLVDGQQIAGLGEAYADEILHASRVRPTRSVASLDEDEVRHVYYAIVEVLQKAIRFGGRADDTVPYVERHPGRFDRVLAVHRRKGLPCATCGTRIRIETMADGPAFYCPRCQR